MAPRDRGAAGEWLAVTRRDACLLGAALPAAALLTPSPLHAVATGGYDIRFAVTDRRFPQSLQFGKILAEQGCPALDVTKGLTRLWQDGLVPVWRAGPGAVAGLTQRAVWECLVEQARSFGRRPVFTGHHDMGADHQASTHMLRAPRNVAAEAAVLEDCGAMWPIATARLALRCRADREPPSTYRTARSSRAAANSALQLVSWIIA